MAIWVAELSISPATRTKLASIHHLDAEDVRDAVQCVAGLPFRWDDDPDRGRRAIVETRIGATTVQVVLYPAGDDSWRLGSAYPIR